MHANLHARMRRAKCRQRWKQRVNRAFVYAQGKLAALQPFQLGQALLHFVAQIEQPLGVFLQEHAGVGQPYRSRTPHKQRLAQRILEFANAEADRRLRAVKPLRGARKAAFAGDH